MVEDASRLIKLINDQIDRIETDMDDKVRTEDIKLLLGMFDKLNDYNKNEAMISDSDGKRVNEKNLKTLELELRERQLKSEKVRTYLDFIKGFVSVAAFAAFEVLAHKRDMADVLDRDQMHVRKNPMKLKLW